MKPKFLILFGLSLVQPIRGQETSLESLKLALACTPLAWMAAKHLLVDSNILAASPNASPEISSFIHELLEQHGVKNHAHVSVKLGKKYCSGPSTIIIEWLSADSGISLLESLIYEYKKLDMGAHPEECEALLNLIFQQIGSIEHEIAHIKNNDLKKRALFLTTITALSYGSLKLMEQALNYYAPSDNDALKTSAAYCLAAGTFLAICNSLALFKLDRAQERAADANISNNPAILLAKANQHAEIHESVRSYVQEKWYGKKLFWLFERFPSLYIIFDWHHPASIERAHTFANRLANLLNQEQNSCLSNSDIL